MIASNGHVKLTDFGLSEINHKITLAEILPTPKILNRTTHKNNSYSIRSNGNNTENKSNLDEELEDSHHTTNDTGNCENLASNSLTKAIDSKNDIPLINLNNNEYYESHQRTPGQILSLTSNIEFSPFFNSSVCELASPEYGRRLADNKLKLINNNGSKINFQKIIHQQHHQNLSRQIFNSNSSNEKIIFPNNTGIFLIFYNDLGLFFMHNSDKIIHIG